MPDFRVSPISIVNQIKSNLQDRYDSGYPVLKELLQNADDAEARRFRLDALLGWPTAENPLLHGPGLLVVNDGLFRKDDERGITSFGESGKATDSAAIGKFGLGQKAVFHLCDAFVVYAYGDNEPFSTVVNPFLGVDVDGNISRQWEPPSDSGLVDTDLKLLRRQVSPDFPDRCLALWLPFRREGLRPAPGVGFSSNFPSASETIAELSNPDDLRLLLTALRHLESVDIREHGETRCAIGIDDVRDRLLGPKHWHSGTRSFGGTIKTRPDQSGAQFVGREAMILDGRLAGLRLTPHWPKTISVLSPTPQPEKGEPHGAATLLRASKGAPSQLRISWAVFLPISEASDIAIPLDGNTLGQFRLLLHGYFFLDSGRRRIEGLTASAKDEEPSDASGLRRAWNSELRDSVVLPLLPALLRDALSSKMVTSAELAQLVAAVAGSEWFQTNRSAICRESALVRVLEAPSGNIWRLVPSGSTLRPLPKSVADAPGRIEELFAEIHSWAQKRKTLLCLDKSASLTAEPMRWAADDLDSLFAVLSPRAFQSGALAPLLADFLASVDLEEANRRAVGPHLVFALRKAMIEPAPLSASEHVSAILAYVPHGLLFPLPTSVEHRQVLRALASAPANILPVRGAWIGDALRLPRLSKADLRALVSALEPHIASDDADQAATAALAMLVHAEQEISELARDPDFASIKVLRARDLRTGGPTALSLQALFERSQAGLLFASSPEANRVLPLLVDVLPDATPLVVEGKTAEFLRESAGSTLSLHVAGKESVFALINRAARFGPEDSRSRLLERLRPADDDDRAALRRLCAGERAAGYTNSKLWILEGAPVGIERIATAILGKSESDFLVPSRIAAELTPKLRTYLGIVALDTEGLEALLDRHRDAIAQLEPTAAEREAFLQTQLSDSLLRRLPIHVRSDGAIGDAENVFREADWPIPATLREHVRTIQPCSNPFARERQQRLITAWSPFSQLEIALSRAEPHRLRSDILDALAKLAAENSEPEPRLYEALRTVAWLIADERPIAPQDILALPPSVDEAARALLLRSGQTAPFLPVRKLAIDVREHPGFAHLEKSILPDQRSSFEALGLLIEDSAIVGRLGQAGDYPIDDFTVLAGDGGDLGLPGWPLVAAILNSLKDRRDDAMRIIAAFSGLDAANAGSAADHLDSLAELAEEKGRRGEAARRAYLHGFGVVAKWPEEARRRVFRGSRVPTEGGGWRSGREVIEDGDGIDPKHILARDCATTLRRNDLRTAHAPDVESVSSDPVAPNHHRGEIKTVDLADLEAKSAEQQRLFLQAWRGRVPSDLVIIYLGLIGRNAPFKQLANEWVADATADVDTLWADLDNHFPSQVLYPGPLSEEVDQRRFLIEQVAGQHVRAMAMSSDLFDAPLGGADNGILIGNLHKTPEGIRAADGKARSLITLPVRHIDLSGYGQREACSILRRFVEAIALDCLWLGMANQQAALQDILDKAVDVDQSTLEETERLLRDRLPTILAELKLPTEYRAQKALREYQNAEGHLHRLSASPGDMEKLKTELWQAISEPEMAVELLAAVRGKIRDFGYSASRVLFELFQNADDAYRQQDAAIKDACFRVEISSEGSGGFRVIHWGRPINHLGPDARDGRRLGHDRDLLNMLLMNFSEKRPGEDLTGKFGLGFKSVHVLSDSVGIASGFIALRTVGGFVPTAWPNGIDEAEVRKRSDGRKATVIDVPFSAETSGDGDEAARAFRASMTWIPAFARAIRRVEILGDDPVSIDCTFTPLIDESAIQVVSIVGTRRQRGLRFDLVDRYSLLLRVDAAGPCPFSNELRRLWNLAPLEEDLRSGWLLNGPFAVDPGRGRLAGSIAERQEIFRRLGRTFGDRLLQLHDLATSDWSTFASALDLDASEQIARNLFWSHLFDVFGADFDDDLARHLHANGHGYGLLAAERPVVPTHLPQPFDAPVRASEVDHFTDAALSEPAVLEKVRGWRALADLEGRTVASDVAGQLKKLGFGGVRPITLADVLRREMGHESRIDFELAARLGDVLSLEGIEQELLGQERKQILDVAKQAHFLAQDGSWRSVRDINSEYAGSEDEKLLSRFAPGSALLDQSYQGAALEFFKVARSQSGYGPQASLLLKWSSSADNADRQRAVLWYVIAGRQGRALAEVMRSDFPAWIPQPLERLLSDSLLDGWSDEDRKRLLFELGGHYLFNVIKVETTEEQPKADPQVILNGIHDWWSAEGVAERDAYASRVYPTFFAPSQLRETGDRAAWFTMFSLACFQSFGRAQDGQHRVFIETGWREGWWQELAESRPPSDVQSWLDRLEGWSAPEQFDQAFLPWRRAFVDLYTVARWLDEYVEVVRKLPRIIQDRGPISLNDVLRPSYSPVIMPLGLDAAPLSRSLGIGMNWMIREMLRQGVYAPRDAGIMAPYCWAPSQRVRELLNALSADVGVWADKEASRAIHEFVVKHIGADRARFNGDFDLPLQLITRETHRAALDYCFEVADRDPPNFAEAEEDGEDALPFEVVGR
jgi:hypothetical protein